MLSDRKTAFWVVVTLIVCLFTVFVLIAAFFTPDLRSADDVDPGLRPEVENIRQAVWWTTMAVVMLPIIMMLITLAMYLFITGTPSTAAVKVPAAKRGGLFGSRSRSKRAEPASTSDVLDLRYARGEITRDQYLSMKADLAAHHAQQPHL